jgi:SAM-dependent methyltransferase
MWEPEAYPIAIAESDYEGQMQVCLYCGTWRMSSFAMNLYESRIKVMLDKFLRNNESWSNWIEARLPKDFTTQLKLTHQELAKDAADKVGVVVDVGAGHMSPFARNSHLAFVIGIDIAAEQIARNFDIDAGIVATAYQLPIRDSVVDVVVTRTLIEHLSDTKAFMCEVARVLRPGGIAIQVFPGGFAPFALLNRVLPETIKRRLLLLMFPDSRGVLGFPAFYDQCTEPAMNRLLHEVGFQLVDSRCYYYQSLYYKKFFPLYLVSLVYDLILWRLNIRILASQILIVAKRHT